MKLTLDDAIALVQGAFVEGWARGLSPQDINAGRGLRERCIGGDPVARTEMQTFIRRILESQEVQVPGMAMDEVVHQVYAESWGLGAVQAYWDDPSVDELQVTPHYVVLVQRGRVRREDSPLSEQAVRLLIERVVSHHGGINERNPHVEAVRFDSARVTATVQPASTFPILILRRHSRWAANPSNLIEAGLFDEQGAALLEMLVRSRHNIAIIGPCGSGKTTIQRVCAGWFHPILQIVTLETGHPELLLSEFYPGRLYKELVAQDPGDIAKRFEAALRESPDIVITAEVRSALEAAIAERAAARGHAGSLFTYHALTPEEFTMSFAELLLESGRTLPLDILQRRIADRVNIVIAVRGDTIRGVKRLISITELVPTVAGLEYRPLCRWVPSEGDYLLGGSWEYMEPSRRVLTRLQEFADPDAMRWWGEERARWEWQSYDGS